jgi:hypothetical protein
MYAHSHVLKRLPDTPQTLWRYVSPERLAQLVTEQHLYFTNLTTFRDGREGGLTARTEQRIARWFQDTQQLSADQAHEQVSQYVDHQKQFYVNCWHINPIESYLMWRAYADRGVAVRTTSERLRASFPSTSPSVTGGVVEYVDFERDHTSWGNVFDHVATKDSPYADEREFRLIFWAADPTNASVEKTSAGVRVPVDVEMLIDCVVVNPFKIELDVPLRSLLDLLEKRGIAIRDSRILEKGRDGRFAQ